MKVCSGFVVLAAMPALAFADVPSFLDVTAALPHEHVYAGPWEHFVGGGVAVFDCNGDTLPELFAAGGVNPARLLLNTSKTSITFEASDVPEITGVTGAYPIDIDGDGLQDLFILRVGPNQVWQGRGGCTFKDVTSDWGIDPGDAWSTAFTATWEAGQAWPTLIVGNYVDRADPDGPFEACDSHQVFRPNGAGYGPAEPLAPGYCTLSMLFSDEDADGVPSLRVSNDRHYHGDKGHEQMFDLPDLRERGFSEAWEDTKIFGMGIASQDITGDGLPEVMLTSMGDQLMQLNSKNGFDWAPFSIGTFAQRPYIGDQSGVSTGWHAQFGDVDNDGRADLFIAKGNVDEMPEGAMADPNNLLMQKRDGTFEEKGHVAGVASTDRGRGAALADLNRDGWLDLVVVNRRAPMQVWQNAGITGQNWVSVSLSQPTGNRNAIGAKVELRTPEGVRVKEVTLGGGHAGGQMGPIHFGLGLSDQAEARITWPDGQTGDWQSLDVGKTNEITR